MAKVAFRPSQNLLKSVITRQAGGSQRSYALCPPLSTAIHSKEKVAKRKEEQPTTDFFFSSNDKGNDHLKSGQQWSEELGAPPCEVLKSEKLPWDRLDLLFAVERGNI